MHHSCMQALCRIRLTFGVLAIASAVARQDEAPKPPTSDRSSGARVTVAGNFAEKPKVERTEFGSITIAGKTYRHDVIIRLDGAVEKRKKKLSKQVHNTSHIISLEEAKHVYQEGAQKLIIGSGQNGMVQLSDEAAQFFKQKGCTVELAPTPAAMR